MKKINVLLTTALMVASQGALSAALEEVVVTAQKRAESLQDVPVAVSAFRSDQLEDFGIADTKALQMVTPSLVYNNRGGIAQPYIRGIGTTLSLLGLEPSIATYVDDQYYSRPGGNIMELPDLERIEVLKGPQGTLYGRNATGGAIRVITKNPTADFESTIKLFVGDYDYRGLSAYINGALSDNLFSNFSVLVKKRSGFAENRVAGNHDLDDLDTQTYRSKITWEASDTITAKLAMDYTARSDTAGTETINITGTKNNLTNVKAIATNVGFPTGEGYGHVYSGQNEDNEQDMFNASLRVDVDLDEMIFSSISTYQDSKLDQKGAGDFDTSELVLSDVSDSEENEAFSQEFQLISDNDSDFNWVMGTYFFSSEGEYELTLKSLLFGDQTTPTSKLDTTAWALFGQATYQLTDELSLTVGGRYSEEKKEVQATPNTFPLPAVDTDETWEKFTPTATLTYNNDLGMVYLTYSQGFKSGGFAYPVIKDLTDAPVDPETLDMWELGAKVDLLDNTLRLNGALYFYDYEDLQVNRNAGIVPGVGIALPVENAGGAEILGVELDTTWVASDALTVTAGFNWMDTEYTDYENATPSIYSLGAAVTEAVDYDATGDEMLRAPEFSAYLSLNYVFSLPNDATMPLNITYSYKGDYNFDLMPGTPEQRIEELHHDSYELINARLTYRPASEVWSLALWVNNLEDKEYYDEVVAFGTAIRATLGAPRTFGADFTYHF